MHLLAFTIVYPRLELGVAIPWLLRKQLLFVGKAHTTMSHVLRTILVDTVTDPSVVRKVLVDVAREVVGEV